MGVPDEDDGEEGHSHKNRYLENPIVSLQLSDDDLHRQVLVFDHDVNFSKADEESHNYDHLDAVKKVDYCELHDTLGVRTTTRHFAFRADHSKSGER